MRNIKEIFHDVLLKINFIYQKYNIKKDNHGFLSFESGLLTSESGKIKSFHANPEQMKIENISVSEIFFQAVKNKEYDKVEQYLPTHLNSLCSESFSALHYACINLDLKMVDLLLSHGANPHPLETSQLDHITGKGKKHLAPFFYLLEKNHTEACPIARKFLDYGLDVNAASCNHTPISFAIFAGNYAMLLFLLENGADIHAKHAYGQDAFTFALERDYRCDIVELLCQHSKDLEDYRERIPPQHVYAHEVRKIIDSIELSRSLEQNLQAKPLIKAFKI